MVITFDPLPQNEAGRLNTLVNFQPEFTPLHGQFSAGDNNLVCNLVRIASKTNPQPQANAYASSFMLSLNASNIHSEKRDFANNAVRLKFPCPQSILCLPICQTEALSVCIASIQLGSIVGPCGSNDDLGMSDLGRADY